MPFNIPHNPVDTMLSAATVTVASSDRPQECFRFNSFDLASPPQSIPNQPPTNQPLSPGMMARPYHNDNRAGATMENIGKFSDNPHHYYYRHTLVEHQFYKCAPQTTMPAALTNSRWLVVRLLFPIRPPAIPDIRSLTATSSWMDIF